MSNSYIERHREKLKLVPKKPGVYIMKDINDRVIYVGKAKALQNRLSQYFIGTPNNRKTMMMVTNVYEFDYILTKTEKDALILENNLIKKYKPKYNILLKDDKTYPFIKVNLTVPYPYLSLSRKTKNDGNKYYGPFLNAYTVNNIIDLVSSHFKLRSCDYNIGSKKRRECINYHIGKCTGPCAFKISKEDYNERVNNAIEALSSNLHSLIPILKEKMEKYSENLDFENAAIMRDRLKDVEKFAQKHNVVTVKKIDLDCIAFYRDENISAVSVLRVKQGVINNKHSYTFMQSSDITDEELVTSFTEQYYLSKNDIPKRIVISINTDYEVNLMSLSETLTTIKKEKVTVSIPRGKFTKNLNTVAIMNAKEAIKLRLETKIDDTLFKLKEKLGLSKLPLRIESYDMSNTSGSNAVGVMTVFENGTLNQKEKRTFIIKGTNGSDDYASMKEVIERRMENLFNGEDGFSKQPDLILVDGGKGQVKSAIEAMNKFGYDFPVFGMVKNDKHRLKDLTNSSCTLNLKEDREVFVFIGKIDEQTHKNAIAYHKKRNTLTSTQSELLSIEGVGQATMKKLYKKFKTISNIKSATFEELSEVVPKTTAKRIAEFYKEQSL